MGRSRVPIATKAARATNLRNDRRCERELAREPPVRQSATVRGKPTRSLGVGSRTASALEERR